MSCWPVKIASFLRTTGAPRPWRNSSLPNGTGPWPRTACCASADRSTRRASSVAVRPRMSLARAVSCTPGSCTTMRSAPWRWMTGSATPSSLIRLFRVVMFCCSEVSRNARTAASVRVATSLRSLPRALRRHRQVGLVVAQDVARPIPRLFVPEPDLHAVAAALDSCMAHILVPQQPAQVAGGGFDALAERLGGVDLHQEMHAAAQVEPEIHGQCVQPRQPLRRTAEQVQGSDVDRVGGVAVECFLQHVPRAHLHIGRGEPHLDRVGVAQDPVVVDAGALERVEHLLLGLVADLDRRLQAGHLHRRRLAEEIRQRVGQPEQQGDRRSARIAREDIGSLLVP